MTNSDVTLPSLFGIKKSNRDFSDKETWGKNQFNNAFPASLASYMSSKGIKPVYLELDKEKNVKHGEIDVETLFGINPNSEELYFDFESHYQPFEELVTERLPRIDLVTKQKKESGETVCLKPIEIKLTTLPDNSTCDFSEDKFSTEIVTRPDTLVYLSLSIAINYKDNRKELLDFLEPVCSKVSNWSDSKEVISHFPSFIQTIDNLLFSNLEKQSPLVMQPVWKTEGKSAKLSENCLDIFIWSDYAFTRLFIDISRSYELETSISRQMRSTVWLIKMLYDFAVNGKLDHRKVIDELSYNTKNDKAFAVSGIVTLPYLTSAELKKPRIRKEDISKIILGGGELMLSPERRLDGVIQSTPGLFE